MPNAAATVTIERMKSLITRALDFWSAEGIDMPDIDLFDEMVRAVDYKGEVHQDFKPVGLTNEEFEAREKFVKQLLAKRKDDDGNI